MEQIKKMRTLKYKRKLRPTQTLILGFLCVILAGTFLLMLPVSSASGSAVPFSTALFTATSATCVTGLSVEVTNEYWTLFGQVVILALIQIGGLGFMSMAVLFFMLVKRATTPYDNMIVAQNFSLLNNEDAASVFMKRIIIGTAVFEAAGAIILAVRFIPEYGVADGIYKGIFHSVSAFCNAGFDIIGPSSMAPFSDDYVVMGTISLLIMLGGIGFVVWDDVRTSILYKKRLMMYTKVILIATGVLVIGGTAVIATLEWNSQTLEGMGPFRKIFCSFFHTVSLRTAGFSVFDNGLLTDSSKVISMAMMFIGGASGSTAGGVKISTVTVLLVSVAKIASGHDEVTMFKKKIPNTMALKSASLVAIGLVIVISGAMILDAVEPGVMMMDATYETFSAYCTVGNSTGITSSLGNVSRYVLCLLMFMGRVGILTITFSLSMKRAQKKSVITYPEAKMLIG